MAILDWHILAFITRVAVLCLVNNDSFNGVIHHWRKSSGPIIGFLTINFSPVFGSELIFKPSSKS